MAELSPGAAYEITVDEHGNRHGTDGAMTVTLLGTEGRMFKRCAIKGIGSGDPQPAALLVTELNGVRVYQTGAHVVVTTEDLHP